MLCVLLSVSAVACQSGWSEFNEQCYKHFSDEKTWQDAGDECVKEEVRRYLTCESALGITMNYQANLVSIHSDEEHQFVLGLTADPWIGARRDPANRASWLWSDETAWDYTNWAPGAPNDSGGDEDCVRMFENNNSGQWNDKECSDRRDFVCKKGFKS